MWTRTMLHKPLFGYKKETISGDINFRKWQTLCSGKKQQQKKKLPVTNLITATIQQPLFE